ncbi:transcriptional repressor [Rhodoferax sp. 4810]|uniref:Ferric uptake regulation protein n=1 Tax=Thiospirillum jenense TaxID=1653858 RepID=A0A839HD16_9GAMM|nr:transcriptional repressor [Thiospirillum jenense]MBB1075425.1 transcriptional repressor [Rhodoferax jenense]MBB1126803.1 transcriptional repressor [Thiospirillum jenense]
MNAVRLQQALAQAEMLCHARGVRLTDQRRRVLEIICRADRPLGAYAILENLRDGTRAAPPTVYRALDFLLEQGLVHRLETLHAFINCTHPEQAHNSQFLVCKQCGEVKEFSDQRINDAVNALAIENGFQLVHPVVELLGNCGHCTTGATKAV